MGLMHTERRAHKRYVIDGLMIELGGVVHETVDISVRAVAVMRKAGMDYGSLKGQARFGSPKSSALDCPIASFRTLFERRAVIVIDYIVEHADWETVLAAHDVRADIPKLENVFD
jgi:hypothetical protein